VPIRRRLTGSLTLDRRQTLPLPRTERGVEKLLAGMLNHDATPLSATTAAVAGFEHEPTADDEPATPPR
jgi:hypothetical protein